MKLSKNLQQCKDGHDYELHDYGFKQEEKDEYLFLHLRCLRCGHEVVRKAGNSEFEIINRMDHLQE